MGIADSLDVIARAAAAADRPDPLTGQWALVTSVTPLLVVLDGDATRTPRAIGANAAGPLQVGWRVWVLTQGKRLVVAAAPAQVLALQGRLAALEARPPYAMAAGEYSGGSTSQPHTATITFPAGRFSVAPIVSATINNSAGGTDGLMVTVGTVTETSMQLVFLRQAGAATANRWCTATWTATQMTPAAAGG